MAAACLIISLLRTTLATSCYDAYSYPVLIGNKDAVAPTETKGLCTAFTDDLLFFAFLSNDKTLRAEEQSTEYTYLGYMVFSNFDNAATMSTNYKKIAYIDKNPEGYLCYAKNGNFFLATDAGEIVRIV